MEGGVWRTFWQFKADVREVSCASYLKAIMYLSWGGFGMMVAFVRARKAAQGAKTLTDESFEENCNKLEKLFHELSSPWLHLSEEVCKSGTFDQWQLGTLIDDDKTPEAKWLHKGLSGNYTHRKIQYRTNDSLQIPFKKRRTWSRVTDVSR